MDSNHRSPVGGNSVLTELMLGRQQEPPVLRDPKDHPGAVDVGDLERDDLGRPQSRS